jgi:hypothetical protein
MRALVPNHKQHALLTMVNAGGGWVEKLTAPSRVRSKRCRGGRLGRLDGYSPPCSQSMLSSDVTQGPLDTPEIVSLKLPHIPMAI